MPPRDGITYLSSLDQWKGRGGFDLKRISTVLAALGDPQTSLPCVHVAGTNGKGSVSVAIASILGQSGYRVGLTTSPHLRSLNERICIDGFPVEDGRLSEYAIRLMSECSRLGERLSFFEAITTIAFMISADSSLDWFVAEVGLGGRLDATNVISRPAASVIVSIAHDHEDILGLTLEKIAYEKAGIIKPGCPCIVGDLPPEALKVVIDFAESVGSATFVYGRDFEFCAVDNVVVYRDKKGRKVSFKPSLNGGYQRHNMAVAIATCLEVGVSTEACQNGVEAVFWPGRLEFVQSTSGRSVLFDAAHNPAGIMELCRFMSERGIAPLEICFGAIRTKQWQDMIAIIAPLVRRWNLLAPRCGQAVATGEMCTFLSSIGVSATDYGADYASFIADRVRCSEPGTILVCGSIYLMGEVRSLLLLEQRRLWKRKSERG